MQTPAKSSVGKPANRETLNKAGTIQNLER